MEESPCQVVLQPSGRMCNTKPLLFQCKLHFNCHKRVAGDRAITSGPEDMILLPYSRRPSHGDTTIITKWRKCHFLNPRISSHGDTTIMSGDEEMSLTNPRRHWVVFQLLHLVSRRVQSCHLPSLLRSVEWQVNYLSRFFFQSI
jgi:hypothetical protein